MHKSYFILLLLVLVCVSTVAGVSMLEIDKVEISSDGDRIISSTRSGSDIKLEPGQDIRIEVRLENHFSDESNNDIEDVEVVAFIDGIDEGDEIDDESDRVSVRADGKRTVTLRLDIPEDASSYESYDLEIYARGYDEEGVLHSDEIVFDVDINREDHELIFEDLRVSDAYCDQDATINLEILNLGESEEYDVLLTMSIDNFGTIFRDEFDLESISEDDGSYRKTKRLDLEDLGSGTHELRVSVLYDDAREKLERIILFDVESCGSETQSDNKIDKREDDDVERYTNRNRDLSFLFDEREQEVVVQMPPPGPIPTPPKQPPAKESAFGIFVLILANLVLIFFIALLIRSFLIDREEKELKKFEDETSDALSGEKL